MSPAGMKEKPIAYYRQESNASEALSFMTCQCESGIGYKVIFNDAVLTPVADFRI
jgi:hypothetical protein